MDSLHDFIYLLRKIDGSFSAHLPYIVEVDLFPENWAAPDEIPDKKLQLFGLKCKQCVHVRYGPAVMVCFLGNKYLYIDLLLTASSFHPH